MNRPGIVANGGATSRMAVAHGGVQLKAAVDSAEYKRSKETMMVSKAPEPYQILTLKLKARSPLVGFIPQRYHRIVSHLHSLTGKFYNDLVPVTQWIQLEWRPVRYSLPSCR